MHGFPVPTLRCADAPSSGVDSRHHRDGGIQKVRIPMFDAKRLLDQFLGGGSGAMGFGGQRVARG
jgi:hypothetical protein